VSDCTASGNRLSFSLFHILFASLQQSSDEESVKKKRKAKAIPQATVMAGVSSQFEKRNRMIRFSSTFFSSADTHTHIRIHII
jgi:hypothetical protein